MGWDIELVDNNGNVVFVESHQAGGVIAIGGNAHAEMCLTFNYAPFYFPLFPNGEGLRWIHEKMAGATVSKLEAAIAALGDEPPSTDYWQATAGNARKGLEILLLWARQYPRARWICT